jgi:hypothetical protein
MTILRTERLNNQSLLPRVSLNGFNDGYLIILNLDFHKDSKQTVLAGMRCFAVFSEFVSPRREAYTL